MMLATTAFVIMDIYINAMQLSILGGGIAQWLNIRVKTLPNCGTLSKLLNLSVPQFYLL